MKLWIRSKERDKLEVCNSLSIQPIITPNKKHHTWGVISNFGCVGEYGTRERCLEILDEIQGLLRGDLHIFLTACDVPSVVYRDLVTRKNNTILCEPSIEYFQSNVMVYQMPEE